MLKHYASNLLVDMQVDAKRETHTYIKENMADAPFFERHVQMVRHAVQSVDAPGLFLEFGVGRGKSMRWIAEMTNEPVYGFDSFDGIPEYWNGNPIGSFAQRKRPKLPENVVLQVGMFDETLPDFLDRNPDPIAFLHIDCDLYSSTATVLAAVGSRLQPGTIVLFDEYYNFPRWRLHEFRAFQEFVSDSGMKYEYFSYSVTGNQVAVRVLANPIYFEPNPSSGRERS